MTEQQPGNGQANTPGAGNSIVQQYIEQYTKLAQQLNASKTIEDAMEVIAPIDSLDQDEQITFLKEISQKNDLAAADLAQALMQLSDNKAVRKEARRRIVQLENNDIYSEWEPPTANRAMTPSAALEQYLSPEPALLGDDEDDIEDDEDDGPDSESFRDLLSSFEELLGGSLKGPEYLGVVDEFLDAWAEGDYEIAYECLAENSPLRDGLSEEAWVESREAWAKVAHPEDLRLNVIEPLKDEQGKEIPIIDVCWSLCIEELPETTLPELPLTTLVFKETGRRWFWTRYTLAQYEEGWRIQEMSDEAANAFRLPREVLLQRMEELDKQLNEAINQLREEDLDDEDEDEELMDEVIVNEDDDDDEDEEEEEDEEDDDEDEDDDDNAVQSLNALFGGMTNIINIATHYLHYCDAFIAQDPQGSQDRFGYAFTVTGVINDIERGAVYAQQAAEYAPEQRGVALRNLAYTYMLLSEQAHENDDHELEEDYLEKVETIARESLQTEEHPKTRILLGTVLLNKNDDDESLLEEAESCFRIAEKGPNTQEDLIEIERGLGEIAELRDDMEGALHHYQNLTHLEPESADVWQKVGLYQVELKHFTPAIEALQRSIALDKFQEETYSLLAYAYVQTNNPAKAREVAREGITNNPDSAVLHSTLAMLYINSGDWRSAEKYQHRAEKLDADDPLVQEVHQTLKLIKQHSGQPKNKTKSNKRKKR